MRFLYPIAFFLIITGSSCKKIYKTDARSGREFLARLAPQAQYFEAGTDSVTGMGGVQIKLTGPFGNLSTGEVEVGDVEISLIEYLTPEEMMFADMPTQDGVFGLITGGAFKLKAEIEGQTVMPAHIAFHLPSSTQSNDMSLYRKLSFSNWDPIDNGELVWNSISGQAGYSGSVSPNIEWYLPDGYLGIACNYWAYGTVPITDFTVSLSNPDLSSNGTSVAVLFENDDVFMSGTWTDQIHFYNVPVNQPVRCIVVGVKRSTELYFGMQSFSIAPVGSYEIEMESISEEDLDDILNGL